MLILQKYEFYTLLNILFILFYFVSGLDDIQA